MDVVLPDGTRAEPPRARSRRSAGIVALLAVVGGTAAIGLLTAPEPEPETILAPTTTSTTIDQLERPLDLENFSVDQIAVGDPLEWTRAAGIDDLYARQVVEHDGVLYLFGSTEEPWSWVPNPIVVWRSGNGRDWESLGTVLETEGLVRQIVSTAQGLIVVESGPSGLTIWRSDDAIQWEPETIRVEEVSELTVVYPGAVAANTEVLAVTGSVQSDVSRLINERILERDSDIDLTKYGWGYDDIGGETQFVVYGPLGIHLVELSPDELALTADQVELLTTGNDVAESIIWVHHAELGWRQATIGDAGWVESLFFDGARLLAFGYDQVGSQTWVSEDGGLNWVEEEGSAAQPWGVVPWGDRFAGMHQGGVVDIVIADDGVTWERANLDEHFPAQLGWYPSTLAAGPAGVSLAAEGWSYTADPTSPDPSPTLLTRDGVTLSLEPNLGEVELVVDGHVHTWRMYSDQSQDGIEVDLQTKEVSFHDPETGEPLATFSIDELMDAERSYGFESSATEQTFQAFVFSPDARSWIIQDVEEDFGDGTRVMSMAVTDDAVIALVGSWNNLYGTEPGLEIWTAPVP